MAKRTTSDWNGKIVADRKAAPNRPKYWGRCSTMGSRHEVLCAPEGAHRTFRHFARVRLPNSPVAVTLTVTGAEPRLRQNQPCLPSKAATIEPSSPPTPRPFL